MKCRIVNLEHGMPTVEIAKTRFLNELATAKITGQKVIKVIHGYGSSGKGGAIKKEIHKVLAQKLSSKNIRCYVKGEDFTPYTNAASQATSIMPQLKNDSDYGRQNDGITIVIV